MLNNPPDPAFHILHILRAPIGGLFRHVSDLAEQQARMGYKVGIVCDSMTGGHQALERIDRLRDACALGIKRIPMSRTLGTRDFSALGAVKHHVEEISPHIVHGHGAKGGAYARLLRKNRDRISVYTLHGGSLHYKWTNPAGSLYLGLERLLRRRSGGLIFESRFAARAYVQKMGAPKCPARIIPNGLADSEFSVLDDSNAEYDAVFVGELRKLKGVGTLIEAVSWLVSERPFRLAIAGTGPDAARFKAEVAARRLEKHIDFLGHQPARSVFSSGRMVVVPSLAESFPYVILEAIGSGRPIVATAVGGVPEMFGPYSEHLVPPNDAIALADAIRDTLDRPVLARQRAAGLHGRARRLFSIERMAHDITDFYLELRRSGSDPSAEFEAQLKVEETGAV